MFNNPPTTTTVTVDAITFVLSIVTLSLSSIVLYVGIFKQKLRSIDIYILNTMSIVDIFLSLVYILFNLTKWITSYTSLQTDLDLACQIQGTISIFSLEVSSDLASLLALIRYLVIVHKMKLSSRYLFLASPIFLLTVVFSILSAYYQLPRIMVSGSYCEPITLQGSTFSNFYSWWLLIRIFLVPLILVFCYLNIGLHYYYILQTLKDRNAYYQNEHFIDDIDMDLKQESSLQQFQLKRLNSNPDFSIPTVTSPSTHTKTDLLPNPKVKLTSAAQNIRTSIFKLSLVSLAYFLSFLPSLISSLIQKVSQDVDDLVYVDLIIFFSNNAIIFINPLFAILVHDETWVQVKKLFS